MADHLSFVPRDEVLAEFRGLSQPGREKALTARSPGAIHAADSKPRRLASSDVLLAS